MQRTTQPPDTLPDAALFYASIGWPVLPVLGKQPIGDLVPHAHEDASLDSATIAAWWRARPDANIGIALGAAGLIDVAPDSFEWWAEFTAAGLPPTWHFASGGGRWHEHWLYPRGDLPAVRIARRGQFDILSDGYAVVPPSVHASGDVYHWLEWTEPEGFPLWLPRRVAEHLDERTIVSDDEVVPADTEVPPINLFEPEQWATWTGVNVGDRSGGLVGIATMLRDAGYQDVEGIASILAERDVSLGWNKYSTRSPANQARAYRAIAQRYGTPAPTIHLTGSQVPPLRGGNPGTWDVGPSGAARARTHATPGNLSDDDPISWEPLRKTLERKPPAVQWVVEGLYAKGLITELVAKVKVGKTTLMLDALRAGIDNQDTFCGRPVFGPVRVGYVTEEGDDSFLAELHDYGIADLVECEAFFTVFDFETKNVPLPKVVDSLIRHAQEDQVDVIVLDTLSVIAGLDEEDHSGKAAAVMHEVRRLAVAGFAVVILRHGRKSGGEVGDAGRGSSAISGYCDLLLQLEPYKGDEDTTNLRVLKSRGRVRPKLDPIVLEFDKATERYRLVGAVQTTAERVAEKIMQALEDLKAFDAASGRTSTEIALKVGGRRTTVLDELKALVLRGTVHTAPRKNDKNRDVLVHWGPRPITLVGGNAQVPDVPEPVGTWEPVETQTPLRGFEDEPSDKFPNSSPLRGEPGNLRKPKTPEAVAKAAEKKAALELARLEAADAAAPTLAYRTVLSDGELVNHIGMLKLASVALDTETTGLSAKRDRLRTVQLSDGETNLVIDAWSITDWSPLQRYLDEVEEVRMHTYLFDLAFLQSVGLTVDPSKVYDVRTAAMVLESKEDWTDYRLQGIAKRHLHEHVDKKEQRRGWDAPVLRHAKLAYAAEDARVTHASAAALAERIARDPDVDGLWTVLALERDVQAATWWLASAGAPADRQVMADAVREQEATLRERLEILNREAGTSSVNWRSPKQVLPILVEAGLDVESTSEGALMDTVAGTEAPIPLISALLEYRSAGACLGLLRRAQEAIEDDGRIYASFNPIGAQTGRTSCSEPNLQNLPHHTRAREAIRPTDGRVFVRADYSQLQLVIAAHIAQDTEMLRILNLPDGDIHQRTADAVGCTRAQAKAVNFGFLFGAGAETFQREQRKNGVYLTEQQAWRYRETFMRTYRGIRSWHRSLSEWGIEATIYDPSGSGRRRQAVFSKNVKANTPVQMVEAAGFKHALRLLYETRHDVPSARLVMMVHDELIAECDEQHADAVRSWLAGNMLQGMQPLLPGVQVRVDAHVTRSYADADK